MIIKSMLVIPTRKEYQNVYQRSFKLNAGHNDINKLEMVFDHTGVSNNGKLTETMLARTMPEIMGLNPNTLGKADVPNGWQTQRLRFMMEIETPFNGNIKGIYLQGFSEYHDPSVTGRIDPRMYFYINSVTTVIKMVDPMNRVIVRPFKTYNVITDLAGGGKYEEIDSFISGTTDLKLIRPTDVFEDIVVGDMYGDTEINNTVGSVGNQPSTSDRGNNDPGKYFTKTLNSFVASRNTSNISYENADIYKDAAANVAEENIMGNEFVYALSKVTHSPSPTKFTLDNLLLIDPGMQNKITMLAGDNRIGYNDSVGLDTEFTSDTLQPTIENMTATTIAQSVSSNMVEHMLTSIDLSFTNKTGKDVVIITDVKSFIEGISIASYVNKLESKIESILMPEVTHNGMVQIEVYVHADLLGDTSVAISINNNPNVVVRFPTFADSLYSPVLTNSVEREGTSNDFRNILDAVITKTGDQPALYS